MPQIKAGENIFQFAIRTAYEYGYLWHVPQKDIHKLKPDDPEVVQAMIAMSKMDALRYTKHTLNEHGRQPDFDGEIGPAMQAMVLEGGRCPVPDIAPPPGVVFQFEDPDLQQVVLKMQRDAQRAIGTGNWPGCHNLNGFHCATISVNMANMQDFLKPLFKTVLLNVRNAYAAVGLLFRFIGLDGKDMLTGESFNGQINSDMSFVSSAPGWIGLAILGYNESCSSKIWNKYDASYRGGQSDAAIIQQWTTLVKHELGHNCGRNHTTGGVMNPSIVNGLPTEWSAGDPSTAWLKEQFGGAPVPIPGGDPPVPPTPQPSLEQRVHALEIQDTVQKVTIDWCVSKIKALGG